QIKSLSRWTPYSLLAITALVVWLKSGSFPESWPVHWNIRGEPDQWVPKTPLGIMFPLIVALILCLFFELIKALIASATIRRSRERMRLEAAAALAEMNRDLLTVMQTAIVVVFGSLSILLPLGAPVNVRWFVLMVLGTMGAAVAFGLWRWLRGMRALRRSG